MKSNSRGRDFQCSLYGAAFSDPGVALHISGSHTPQFSSSAYQEVLREPKTMKRKTWTPRGLNVQFRKENISTWGGTNANAQTGMMEIFTCTLTTAEHSHVPKCVFRWTVMGKESIFRACVCMCANAVLATGWRQAGFEHTQYQWTIKWAPEGQTMFFNGSNVIQMNDVAGKAWWDVSRWIS